MEMTRREFAKGATAGIAGIIASGMAPSLYAAGANNKVRVACVGYSDRFRHTLLPCFLHHNKELNFDMVAVADLWKKRLYEEAKPNIEKAIGHEIEAFGSDVALYDAKDRLGLDAVLISTADFQHA
jgi:predicted dehydrogenase